MNYLAHLLISPEDGLSRLGNIMADLFPPGGNGVVNEKDLAKALLSGQLAGAALDVFDNEPDINPELIGMENIVLTPHIASATLEAREKMGEQAINAILDVFQGEKPENMVNEEVWDKRRK